jgi:hypothetical protein
MGWQGHTTVSRPLMCMYVGVGEAEIQNTYLCTYLCTRYFMVTGTDSTYLLAVVWYRQLSNTPEATGTAITSHNGVIQNQYRQSRPSCPWRRWPPRVIWCHMSHVTCHHHNWDRQLLADAGQLYYVVHDTLRSLHCPTQPHLIEMAAIAC